MIEALVTSTSLGDPIETEALHEVYGADRAADNTLYVSGVKGNIGHLEAAAVYCRRSWHCSIDRRLRMRSCVS